MVAGGGGRVCDVIGLPDQALLSRNHNALLIHVNRYFSRCIVLQRKQPPPATGTMVAGGGDLIIYPLVSHVY